MKILEKKEEINIYKLKERKTITAIVDFNFIIS